MPTSSFYYNLKIDNKKDAKQFVNALEKASKIKTKNINIKYKEVTNPDEIRKIFNNMKEVNNMLKPINDFVLLKEINDQEEKKIGDFVLEVSNPEDGDVRLKKYEVVAISDGYINPQTNTERTINKKIKPGVKVILDKFSGKKVISDNEEFYLVREAEIQAIEEDE